MCINVKKGVTSLGRHTRPGCNLGRSRDLFCIKWCGWMILTSIQCVFHWLPVSPSCHFRRRHPSSLAMRGIWEHVGGSCLRSRFYSTPCFFDSMATHARGLGRSLRFTHAQTNFMHVWVFLWMRLFFTPCQGAARSLVERGHVNFYDHIWALWRHLVTWPLCLILIGSLTFCCALIGEEPIIAYITTINFT